MFLPDEYDSADHSEEVSMYTLEKIETMIRTCSLGNKRELIKRMDELKNEEDAIAFMNYLKDYKGIPGRDYTPHTLLEQYWAIKYNVDKDDFYERNKDTSSGNS